MWRVITGKSFAFILAGIINVKVISWLKRLARGKHFWIRSIGASSVSELIFSFIVTLFIQFGKLEFKIILFMIATSFALKIIYSVVLSIPANVIVFFVKKSEGIEG